MATRMLSPNDIAEDIPSGLHHLFTVDEYHRMIDVGIVKQGDRVQLVGGVVVEVSPQNEKHARLIQRLNRALVRALGEDYVVRPQLPLTLGADSEPEPDLAVVRAEDAASIDVHPRTAVLVIEVSGDSLRFDRGAKAAVYASAGIPEYWVIDVEGQRVEVYSDVDATSSRYRAASLLDAGASLQAQAIAGLSISLDELFR